MGYTDKNKPKNHFKQSIKNLMNPFKSNWKEKLMKWYEKKTMKLMKLNLLDIYTTKAETPEFERWRLML